MALKYYQKGCTSLHNLHDNFIIVHKRYLSLKIINSNKFGNIPVISNNINKIKFVLSAGNISINLPINTHMTINDIKNELYKRPELQNYEIKVLLAKGSQMLDNDTVEKYDIKDNEPVLVIVDNQDNSIY